MIYSTHVENSKTQIKTQRSCKACVILSGDNKILISTFLSNIPFGLTTVETKQSHFCYVVLYHS